MIPRVAMAIAMALSTGAFAGCSESGPDLLDQDVQQLGNYNVGHRVDMVSYTVRATGETRTVPVHLWYPTDVVPDPGFSTEWPVYFPGISENDYETVANAPPRPADYADGYPVVIHAHGAASFGGAPWAVMRRFASHGWLAISVEHVGDTTRDALGGYDAWDWYHRVPDQQAALDYVEGLAGTDPLSEADTSKVLMYGYSRGTYTAWAMAGATIDEDAVFDACEDDELGDCEAMASSFASAPNRDERIVALFMAAGDGDPRWFGGYENMQGITLPMLSIVGDEDPEKVELMTALRANVSNPGAIHLDLEGSCHFTFTSFDCANLPNDVAAPVIGAYAIAFGRHHVLGDMRADTLSLLNGDLSISDLITYSRQ